MEKLCRHIHQQIDEVLRKIINSMSETTSPALQCCYIPYHILPYFHYFHKSLEIQYLNVMSGSNWELEQQRFPFIWSLHFVSVCWLAWCKQFDKERCDESTFKESKISYYIFNIIFWPLLVLLRYETFSLSHL